MILSMTVGEFIEVQQLASADLLVTWSIRKQPGSGGL